MKYKLKDLFDLRMGKTPSRNNSDYWNAEEYKWISIGDLSKTGKYISNTKEHLSKLAIEESGIKLIPANTVIMSFKLSIGKVAITAEDMYSNEAIMAFHDKHVIDILPEYIFYMFKYKNWDEGSNKAVMGKTLNKATLSEVEIEICSVEEQREIVGILDKMMSVLEARENELDLLDTLIKARFVELFGDLKFNPKRWKLEEFDKLTDLITDGEHTTPKRSSDGIFLLSARNILNHSVQLKDVDYINQDEYDRISKRIIPQKGDILISCSGSVGRCCSVPNGLKFQMVRSVALLRFKKNINPIFAEYMITSDYLQEQINNSKTTSSQANLFQGKIKRLKGFVPPIELQNQFADFVHQVNKSKVIYLTLLNKLTIFTKSLL